MGQQKFNENVSIVYYTLYDSINVSIKLVIFIIIPLIIETKIFHVTIIGYDKDLRVSCIQF